jgi:hypothetical protein
MNFSLKIIARLTTASSKNVNGFLNPFEMTDNKHTWTGGGWQRSRQPPPVPIHPP